DVADGIETDELFAGVIRLPVDAGPREVSPRRLGIRVDRAPATAVVRRSAGEEPRPEQPAEEEPGVLVVAVILLVIVLSHPDMQRDLVEPVLPDLVRTHGVRVLDEDVAAPFQVIGGGERKAGAAVRAGRD